MSNESLVNKAKKSEKALETIAEIKFRQNSYNDMWIPFTSLFYREYDAIKELIDEVLKNEK